MKLKDMKKWQISKLVLGFVLVLVIGILYLAVCATTLYKDRAAEADYWNSNMQTNETIAQKAEALGGEATKVLVGTYVENIKELNMKGDNYRVVFQAWFKWEGSPDLDMAKNFRVYKGLVNKVEMIKDYHEGNVNYQLARCDVTVSKSFWTCRFPLESHQLRFYLESNYPVQQVIFEGDTENSGMNPKLTISGFDVKRVGTAVQYMEYDNTHSDPELTENVITSEYMTQMELNRSSWGLYMKCFIALFGTTLWVLIVLFLNTYHNIDPLGMIPAALFGTVSNIMVGANLLPDALQMGLLEYVNIWGIMTIIAVTLAVININRIRTKYADHEFASFFGRLMFYTILVLTVGGHILLPAIAYMY